MRTVHISFYALCPLVLISNCEKSVKSSIKRIIVSSDHFVEVEGRES